MDIFEEIPYIIASIIYDKNIIILIFAVLLILAFVLLIKFFISKKESIASHETIISISLKELLIYISSFLFYPFIYLKKSIKESETVIQKFIGIILSLFILLPAWIASLFSITIFIWFIGTYGGLLSVEIPTIGSSMLPTVLQNSSVSLRRYPGFKFLGLKLTRGDLVVFSNSKTREETKKKSKNEGTFIKRVVALPGDSVVIKDGFVMINDEVIKEPYTFKPRSTFGGKEIKECEKINVPGGKLLVMGDNRKRSLDSRDIGLISIDDVKFFLPYKDQGFFWQRWRNTSHDFDFANRSFLDIDEYVRYLNKKRNQNGLPPLSYNEKLSYSAKKRAEVMLKYNDFSFDSKKSGYPMKKALFDAGYENVIYGEFPVLGYYDANELVDYIFEFEDSKDFVLNKDYDDIGISTFVGELNGCPAQIVVQHLAGYIPPDYKKEEVETWKNVVSRLKEIQPGWKSVTGYSYYYDKNKEDVDRINEIIEIRVKKIEKIIEKMESNEWLTNEQIEYTYKDEELYKEQENIAKKLNSQ